MVCRHLWTISSAGLWISYWLDLLRELLIRLRLFWC
ncbi:hypothetical protein ACJIZ3_019926 [Penstemon smallii]|uniref:Uncharacterized protein n=1 Tax=Penstemon smallii TaxID=265156 RepID=A0ABD3T2J8_9LAMI